MYRCPGHWAGFVRAVAADGTSTYETVTCAACNRVHLVNPVTSHVAGANSLDARS